MLTMSSVRVRLVCVVQNWVAVDVKESPVITRSTETRLLAYAYTVNMGSIFSAWVDTLDVPSELEC